MLRSFPEKQWIYRESFNFVKNMFTGEFVGHYGRRRDIYC